MVALLFGLIASVASAEERDGELSASARVQRESEPGVNELSAEEAARRPFALGEPARAAFDLPGVARGSFAGNELLVWGAAGNETRSYIDGIQLPTLFHPGGFRSTVHPALLDRLTLVPGAAGARYGRGLGGVLDLSTRTLATAGTHVTLRADAIDSSLSIETGSGPVSVLAAGRYGYLDRLVERVAPSSQNLLSIPAHADGALRIEGRPDARSRLTATWLGSRDQTQVTDVTNEQRRSNMFQLLTFTLSRRYADAARVRITPFLGIEDSSERSVFSGVPLTLQRIGSFFGGRAEYTRSTTVAQIQLGIDARAALDRNHRSGTLTLPAREGDVRLYGQAPLDAVNDDVFRTTLVDVAPYLTLGFRLGPLLVEPALRVVGSLIASSASLPHNGDAPPVASERLRLLPEPRMRVVYTAGSLLRLEARAGLYHQQPAPADLSAVFGNPTLGPSRALQACLASELSLPWQLKLEAVGFYRALTDLPVRSASSPPALAASLTQEGTGRAYGGSLSLQRAAEQGFSGAANYTLSRSTRTRADGSERLFDADQTHVLSVWSGYSVRRWTTSLRLRVNTGSPRTAVQDSYDDVTSGSIQPTFGGLNQRRLPLYQQLDAHIERSFSIGPLTGALFLDLINLFNHHNVEQIAYSADYRQHRDLVGLPFLAMLGGRLSL